MGPFIIVEAKMDGQTPSDISKHLAQSFWQKLSPRRLEHHVQVPTAITFHRLVPRTSQFIKSRPNQGFYSFKYLDPEDIENAQLMARQKLLEERLCKAGSASSSFKKSKTQNQDGRFDQNSSEENDKKQLKDIENKKKVTTSKVIKGSKDSLSPAQANTRPKLPVYRGIGETNLRIRQVQKLTVLISECLQDLDGITEKTISKKDFVTPQEIEIKKKRWDEFLHFSGRMVYALKREVYVLEKGVKNDDKSDKFLRMLASSTRNLYKLLMALKTYSESALHSPQGLKFFSELKIICHRLFAVISTLGIQSSRIKLKIPVDGSESGTEDISSDSELAASDVNSSDLELLHPEYVRNRLFQIANEKLNKKRKQKQENGANARQVSRKRKEAKEIVLLPLKQTTSKKAQILISQRQPSQPLKSQRKVSQNKKVVFGECSARNKSSVAPDKESHSPSRTKYTKTQPTEGSSPLREKQNVADGSVTPRKASASETDNPCQHSVIGCRMADQEQLVEQTADAVVHKLMPLISKEKENKSPRESISDTQSSEDTAYQHVDGDDFSRQVQYLLERVCKIEDEQRLSLAVSWEVSQRREKKISYPENTLDLAIKQAQNVLQNLANAKRPTVTFKKDLQYPSTSITINKYQEKFGVAQEYNIEKSRRNSDIDGTEKLIYKKVAHKENIFRNSKGESDEMIDNESNSGSVEGDDERDKFNEADTIAYQIKNQKEEFWASLVNRGFLRPSEFSVDGTTAANEAIELLLKQSSAKDITKDSQVQVQKEAEFQSLEEEQKKFKKTIIEKLSREKENDSENDDENYNEKKAMKQTKPTNMKRDQALAKKFVNKSTLVTSLMSSYSDSTPMQNVDKTQSSLKSSDALDSEEKSNSETRGNSSEKKIDEVGSSHKGNSSYDQSQKSGGSESGNHSENTENRESLIQSEKTVNNESHNSENTENSESCSFPSYEDVDSFEKD